MLDERLGDGRAGRRERQGDQVPAGSERHGRGRRRWLAAGDVQNEQASGPVGHVDVTTGNGHPKGAAWRAVSAHLYGSAGVGDIDDAQPLIPISNVGVASRQPRRPRDTRPCHRDQPPPARPGWQC